MQTVFQFLTYINDLIKRKWRALKLFHPGRQSEKIPYFEGYFVLVWEHAAKCVMVFVDIYYDIVASQIQNAQSSLGYFFRKLELKRHLAIQDMLTH